MAIADRLAGVAIQVALGVVRESEAAMGRRRPGVKAFEARLANDAAQRFNELRKVVKARLAQDRSDRRAQAHKEVLDVLEGRCAVRKLYPPDSGARKK